MRIVYVTASYPFGSGESFLTQEVESLEKHGIELIIIPTYGRGGLSKAALPSGKIKLLDHRIISPAIIISALKFLLKNPLFLAELINILCFSKSAKPIKNLVVLMKAIHMARVIKELNVSHIHCHWAAVSATMAYAISKITGIEWSMTTHRWDIVENNMFLEKSRSAKFVRFISLSGMALAGAKGILNNENAHVIHMGVDLSNTNDSIEITGSEKKCIHLACVGNFIPVKGHVSLIKAVGRLAGVNWHLHLFGTGPMLDSIKQLAIDIGVDSNVTFYGQIPHTDLLSRYSKGLYDILIQPSMDLGNGQHEGIPVSLIEAMAYSIPVIGTRSGGIPELIDDDCGIIVEAGDEIAIRHAIELLIEDDVRRVEMGRKGREKVLNEFNILVTSNRLVELMSGEHCATV